MANKWDDDFDFDDIDDEPKKKQPTKKKQADDDDFFDLDDKPQKLPSISRNSGAGKGSLGSRNSAKKNPYAENIKSRGNIYNPYDVEIDEEVVEEPKKPKKQVEEEINYYEEIEEKPKEDEKVKDESENYE